MVSGIYRESSSSRHLNIDQTVTRFTSVRKSTTALHFRLEFFFFSLSIKGKYWYLATIEDAAQVKKKDNIC